MKIALLHYAAPPVVGGVESVMGHHARLMADDRQQVSILAGRGAQTDPRIPFINIPQADSRHPEVLAVKEELDAGKVTPRFDKLVASLVNALSLALAGVNLVVAHNVCSLNKNLALTAALRVILDRRTGPRLIMWQHDLAWTAPTYRAELHPGYPWDLLRTVWPGTTLVTISEPRRQELAGLLGVPAYRIKVIPNGVEMSKFAKMEAQTLSLVEKVDLLGSLPLFLLPVRITPRKNIELAIRTLAALKGPYHRAKLVVTGPLGPHNPANSAYFNQLLALRHQLGLDQTVIFLAEQSPDYLPDEVIADFYHLADALLLPSHEEGFGIPILEAGLAGIPVFCADIPALRDLGGNFVTYFSPDASPDHVAGLITRRLSADITSSLRMRVKKDYTWQQIYAVYIKPLLMD
jgi:glycosyltransferase involved in cell wall biosynthesis